MVYFFKNRLRPPITEEGPSRDGDCQCGRMNIVTLTSVLTHLKTINTCGIKYDFVT